MRLSRLSILVIASVAPVLGGPPWVFGQESRQPVQLQESQSSRQTRFADPLKNKTPRRSFQGFPKTAFEYAKMVESQLGIPPKINLDEAVEIPIYVDGVQRYGNLGTSCDNPTRLGKATFSGSVIQRYEGRTADNKPLPDVVWVAFGRNSTDNPKTVIGSVQMIGHHMKTGATAFFESSDELGPWVEIESKTLRMRGEMPWIDDPKEFNRAFVPPGSVQCVECHQADPFITNTFINAAEIPGTDDPVIPILDADSPYYVIGGENWDMRTVHVKDNACFECHRIGQSTLKLFMDAGWDANDYMPPHDPGSLVDDLREILEVLSSGPKRVDGAEWVIPPLGEGQNRVVGDDYPNKADFNRWVSGESEGMTEKGLSKTETPEIEALLDRLEDAGTRRAFKAWFEEHGTDQATLQKLRDIVNGKGKK